MAMMTGRVLLVCALCVLWCGAGGRCDDGDGDGRVVVDEPLPESPESRVESKAVSNSLKKRVEEAPTPAKEPSEEGSEATLQGEEGQQQQEGENALQLNGRKTPEILIKQNEAPQAPEVEGIPTAAALEESPTTPGPKAPKLQVPPPSQASGVGEGDGGLVGIGGTSRVTGEDIKDPKGREDPVSGPPSGGASSSTISNNGDASQKNGGALPTQDTTSLESNEQSGPTASSGNAPLNRETPERSTHDAKQHSSDTQENETSQVADGDAAHSTAGQSTVGTKATSGVSTTASNAPTTPQPQLPAPPVPTTATVTGAPEEKPTAERSPPPADSAPGGSLSATTTTQKNHTATPGDSDGSTAVSHTTSPLLLLLVACAAAAAVVAACQ
ncbi:mucin-associated surface protein (MASP) [Trypanosoma cruzi Dm28c]|uniref:Mucin-associated surface protein (MASP) n=2 Tax=Trypanosoma cruzi TaxID=5693 RepID=V5B7I5_TRYCR|nr:mucin-associated surface protein (MASP) [Trypanosoma cruzi Dm28c]PBJ77878.1 mucin-associated surface protein [Trypanosoma cruzi cruzi]PWV03169.1 Mucin-associated surface protein (MASP) [Trypanosoma cruzi]